MVTVVAILSGVQNVEKAIKELSESLIPDLQWWIYQTEPGQPIWSVDWGALQERHHPGQTTTQPAKQIGQETTDSSAVPANHADYIESLAHGSTIILIAASSLYMHQIRQLLDLTQATRILIEQG